MPRYKLLPPQGSLSIEAALKAGKWSIEIPSRIIMMAGIILGIGLPFVLHSAWPIPLGLIGGPVLSFVYTLWRAPAWRLWAYSGVADIHQFQRSAELARLLPRQSPLENYGIMSRQQKQTLAQLQQRFRLAETFIDDVHIPEEIRLHLHTGAYFFNGPPANIVLNDKGMVLDGMGSFSWGEIRDEQVVDKAFTTRRDDDNGSYVRYRTGGTSSEPYLTFYTTDSYIAIPLSSYNMSPDRLDILLYTYRGRYETEKQKEADKPVIRLASKRAGLS